MSFRVAVLVSGEGTNLQAVLDQVHGREGIEVVCVGSNKSEARGLERARGANIETGVFPASDYGDRAERDRALGDWLEAHDADLVVLAGFMELLDAEFVRRFEGRMINVHAALLPAFPGTRPIQDAVEYGVKISGVTVHFVDEGVDSGPVILQESLEVPYSRGIDAIETFHDVEHRLLPRAIRLIARGNVRIDPAHPRRVLVEDDGEG